MFGNKLAVLAGDFLLARASVSLARLRSIPVVELLSTGANCVLCVVGFNCHYQPPRRTLITCYCCVLSRHV